MGKELTIKERLLRIETILQNEIRHELTLHRWLLTLLLSGAIALLVKLLVF